MITFHSYRELTILIFLVMDIMFKYIEKALTIMLLAIGVKLNGEDEQVKKRKTSSVWMKAWFQTVYVQLHTEIYFRNYT